MKKYFSHFKMSLRLPSDLSYLILSHLPTTQIEQYAPFLTDNAMGRLALFKYGFIEPNPRYSALDNYPRMFPARLLNYLRIAAYHGDLGNYSYLIIDVRMSCILAIQHCDHTLLRYYLYMLELPGQVDFIKLLTDIAISYIPDNDEYKDMARYLYCFYSVCDNDPKNYDMSEAIDHIRNDYSNPFTRNSGFSVDDLLLLVLLQFDLTKITQYLDQQGYPPRAGVEFPLLFTQKFVDECKKIYDFVSQNMTSSPILDDYLMLLRIILNQDFDLTKLNNRYLVRLFASFAACLGIDRIDKFLNTGFYFNSTCSRIIYNPEKYLQLKGLDPVVVYTSLWLTGNQMLLYNSSEILSHDIELSKNIELYIKRSGNINQQVDETDIEDQFELNYAEEAKILSSMFETLYRYKYLNINPVNYYQYLKMKQYDIDVNIRYNEFMDKHYFTDADELYKLVLK